LAQLRLPSSATGGIIVSFHGQEAKMTQLLEKALSAVSKLPETEQDAIAAILLQEMASEDRWAISFEKSSDALAKLAGEALAEHASGRTQPL
jgi:hypothetical protein